MSVAYSRQRLDSALRRKGEDAVLRRRIGTSSNFVTLDVRISIRGYAIAELSSGIVQGDSKVILSPTRILEVGPTWPGAAGGVQMPKRLDSLIAQGRVRNIEAVSVIYEGGEPVRIDLQVRG